MERFTKYKLYLGLLLLGSVLIVNICIAANYYNIGKMQLTPFYIWQANIKK